MSVIGHLLWLDLETTSAADDGEIMEIACILTTPDLEHVDTWDAIVTPTAAALEAMPDVVRQMHTVNGLLVDIGDIDEGRSSPDYVDRKVVEWLHDSGAHPHRTVLAGSGVAHFDRRFIARQLPLLDRFLAYYAIDVGVLRRTWRLWAGGDLTELNDQKTHRAIDDVELHLAEARRFRQVFGMFRAGCPSDTNGDGDCGRRLCPFCGEV